MFMIFHRFMNEKSAYYSMENFRLDNYDSESYERTLIMIKPPEYLIFFNLNSNYNRCIISKSAHLILIQIDTGYPGTLFFLLL